MSARRLAELLISVLIPVTVAGGLWVDTEFGAPGISWVNAWVWALFGMLLLSVPAPRRKALVACLFLSTAGELILTELWSVYEYRAGFLPAYVPPGHCLLYYLGVQISRRLPFGPTHAGPPRWAVVFLLLVLVAAAGRAVSDPVGVAATLLIGGMVLLGKNRALYAVMAVLSLGMELWGTALGVWIWSPTLTGTSWVMANPPLGVGILYCTLDALVLGVCRTEGTAEAGSASALGAD